MEREKNIQQIDEAINYTKTAALLMNEIVKQDGEVIDKNLLRQEDHK